MFQTFQFANAFLREGNVTLDGWSCLLLFTKFVTLKGNTVKRIRLF